MRPGSPVSMTVVAIALLARSPALGQVPPEILPGDSAVDASVIQEHRARWRLLSLRGGTEREIAQFVREVDFVHHSAGEPAMLVRWHFTQPNRSGLDTYYLDETTLLPLARYVTSPNGLWVQYQKDDRLTVTHTSREGGPPFALDTVLATPRFNNAMVDLLLAALPLAEGYRARWPVLSTSQSVAAALDGWTEITVTGREAVPWEDATVNAWVVDVSRTNGNPQRMWISAAPPYLLRRDIHGGDGQVAARWEAVQRANR